MATSVALVTVGLIWLFAPAKASAAQVRLGGVKKRLGRVNIRFGRGR